MIYDIETLQYGNPVTFEVDGRWYTLSTREFASVIETYGSIDVYIRLKETKLYKLVNDEVD